MPPCDFSIVPPMVRSLNNQQKSARFSPISTLLSQKRCYAYDSAVYAQLQCFKEAWPTLTLGLSSFRFIILNFSTDKTISYLLKAGLFYLNHLQGKIVDSSWLVKYVTVFVCASYSVFTNNREIFRNRFF